MNFKRPRKLLISLTMLFAFSASAQADIPLMVPYAGSVAVGGEAFDGSGQFKFAIVNKSCTIETEIAKCLTLWSNDGTSATGLEPTDAVQIPVSNGGFSVKLGDTGLTGMTEIPAAVFENDVTFLRVWFTDGSNGFQQLSNDRQLVSVPYAYHADNAKTASSADIAKKVEEGSIDATAIANGSIGIAKVNKSEVQARIKTCDAGSSIRAIDEDGNVICETDNGDEYTAGAGITIAGGAVSIESLTKAKIDASATTADLTNTNNRVAELESKSATSADLTNTTNRVTALEKKTITSTDIEDNTIIDADISDDTNLTANNFNYTTAKPYYYYLSAADFQPNNNANVALIPFDGGYWVPTNGNPTSLYAGVHLPQSAFIKLVSCFYYEAKSTYKFTNLDFEIWSNPIFGAPDNKSFMAAAAINPANSTTHRALTATHGNTPNTTTYKNPIDNALRRYSLRFYMDSDTPALDDNSRFQGCMIQYTVDKVSN